MIGRNFEEHGVQVSPLLQCLLHFKHVIIAILKQQGNVKELADNALVDIRNLQPDHSKLFAEAAIYGSQLMISRIMQNTKEGEVREKSIR